MRGNEVRRERTSHEISTDESVWCSNQPLLIQGQCSPFYRYPISASTDLLATSESHKTPMAATVRLELF